MFDKIGQFASRYRYPIIIFWLIAVVAITLLAPNLADVTISDQSGYLDERSPSVVASQVARDYFGEQASPSEAVLVIHSESGPVTGDAVQAYLADLTGWLENDLNPELVEQVLSPTDPLLAERLISDDKEVAILYVGLNGAPEDTGVQQALEAMQARLDDAPEGFSGYVTGGVAISNDYRTGALASAESTTLITVILVIAILLIIYRSPVLPLVPLITIGIAYGISRAIVAWLTTFGWAVSSITDVFLVVLLFGAGTDYCLFIVSRFREHMADGTPGPEAASSATSRVAETIISSAGTVIVGMVAMSFVELKIFSTSGPSLAIGVLVALLAGLTLTPALLAVLGKHAFWPGKPHHADSGKLWGRLAEWVTGRPWLPLSLGLVILIPLAIYGMGQPRGFDLLADMPDDVPSKAGFLILSDHFGAGEMQPLDVVITDIPDADNPEGLALIARRTGEYLAVEGVADVRSLTRPAGEGDPAASDALRPDYQLNQIAAGIEVFSARIESGALEATGDDSASLVTLRAYLEALGAGFTEVADSQAYGDAVAALDRVEVSIQAAQSQTLVTSQLALARQGLAAAGDDSQAQDLTALFEGLSTLRAYLTGLADAHPDLAALDGYDEALAALDEIETGAANLQKAAFVSVQLAQIADGFAAMSEQLGTNPAALMPQPGQPSAAEQMAAMQAYLDELGATYPDLAATTDYQTAQAVLEQMETSLANPDLSDPAAFIQQAQGALTLLADSFGGLAETAAESLPEATFVPTTPLPGAASAAAPLLESVAKLDGALAQLETSVETAMPAAAYIPTDLENTAETGGTRAALLADIGGLATSLRTLAGVFAGIEDAYFLPRDLATDADRAGLDQMLEMYAAPQGDAARLQIILADDPYSQASMDTVSRLRAAADASADTYITGSTAILADLRDAMDRDMVLVMVLVLSGIAVVLMLLLRSVIAPIYLLLTILFSYGATLGITRIVFDAILHTQLTWFVPFFIFVMVMSLGMDYNIFLMGRVKEEVAGNGTRSGVQRAIERTGGIITSAGIIMAGTFAAMMSSSLIGLVQLAFAITVGILLDTFVVRTTLVPAIVVLLDKWNWWPGKPLASAPPKAAAGSDPLPSA